MVVQFSSHPVAIVVNIKEKMGVRTNGVVNGFVSDTDSDIAYNVLMTRSFCNDHNEQSCTHLPCFCSCC